MNKPYIFAVTITVNTLQWLEGRYFIGNTDISESPACQISSTPEKIY